MEGGEFSCRNLRGINLASFRPQLLADIILHRLSNTGEMCVRENRTGFRPSRGGTDRKFSLRQIFERVHFS